MPTSPPAMAVEPRQPIGKKSKSKSGNGRAKGKNKPMTEVAVSAQSDPSITGK
jgi:hypothetical protein